MEERGEEEEDGEEESRKEQRPEGESLTLCIELRRVVSAIHDQFRCTGTHT